MRFSKVLLVFPDCRARLGAIRPPIGLGYIEQALENAGVECDVVDMAASGSSSSLRRRLNYFKPDLAGLSLMSTKYKASYDIIGFIKSISPYTYIAVGGQHVSIFRKKVLEDCQYIDFGVVSEGEDTICQLCGNEEINKIPGLLYRNKTKIIYNADKDLNPNPDVFAYPLYRKFPLKNYVSGEIGIVTSRGCPGQCIFCSVPNCVGKHYRPRSVEHVIAEIEYWYSSGYRQISICDDNFTFDKERVLDLCSVIIKQRFKGLEFNCSYGIRADTVDTEVLLKMKEAGFRYLSFGVESGNDKVLSRIKKGVSLSRISHSIESALEADLEVSLFFTIGHPEETPLEFGDSLAFSRKYQVADAVFHSLIPFPGTELFDFVDKNNYFTVYPEEYLNSPSVWQGSGRPVFSTPSFTAEERLKAVKMADVVRKRISYLWMKRKLRRLGIFSGMLAGLYVADFAQKILMYSRVRKYLKRIFDSLSQSG
ncbi:MAG: radical SAM protein [Candidatus Omnitrophica bacterium]|nr:radical SAM protein [Candidatus Omnitrophota bacterium]